MVTEAQRKKNKKKKARQKLKKAGNKSVQQNGENNVPGAEISDSTDVETTTVLTTNNSMISSTPETSTIITGSSSTTTATTDDIVHETQQQPLPQQHADFPSAVEHENNVIDPEVEIKLSEQNEAIDGSNQVHEEEENQQPIEEVEAHELGQIVEVTIPQDIIDEPEFIPKQTVNEPAVWNPSIQNEELEQIQEQSVLSSETSQHDNEQPANNEVVATEDVEIPQQIDYSTTEQIMELPKTDADTQISNLENEFHMEHDTSVSEIQQGAQVPVSDVSEMNLLNNSVLVSKFPNNDLNSDSGHQLELGNSISQESHIEEYKNIENIENEEDSFLGERSSINKDYDDTVVHSEMSYNNNSQNGIQYETHENTKDIPMYSNNEQGESLFNHDNDVEIETMPWEQETREPVVLENQEQYNNDVEHASNADEIYEPTEQPATIHSELFTKHEDTHIQPIVQDNIKIENNAQTTNNSNSPFTAHTEQDDELLPWEVETETNLDAVHNVVAPVTELQQRTSIPNLDQPDTGNQGIIDAGIIKDVQQINTDPQNTGAVETKDSIVDTRKNNFSFMDDEEDLLEDDDSFLDSDEELRTDLEPVNPIQESQPLNPNTGTNTNQSPIVSKYAPQVTSNNIQSIETPMERSGIVQPPPMIFNNTIQSPQIDSQLMSTQLQPSITTQKAVETLNKAKQKSDAYDFPSDLLGSNPKPVHAKAVVTPSMRYGSIPSMDINRNSSRKMSAPYSPLQTSAAPPPPPMIHTKGNSQSYVQTSTPTTGQPQTRSRVSSGVNMPQFQPPPMVDVPQPGMPYSRQRAASNLSNGGGLGVHSTAATYVSPLSPQSGNMTGTTTTPLKKNKYAPIGNVQQQIPSQQRSYTQAPNGYVPGPVLLNNTPTMNSQANYHLNGNNQTNGTQQPLLPQTMTNQGTNILNASTVYQGVQQPNNTLNGQHQYYPPARQNITINQQMLKNHEPQLRHSNNYAPQITQNGNARGLGINTQPQISVQQPYLQAESTQTDLINNQNLLRRQFPLFSWGKSNRVVYGIPTANSMYSGTGFSLNTINVVNYDALLNTSDMMKTYIGPLSTKTKKLELEKWLNSIVSTIPQDSTDTTSLIWYILRCYVSGIDDLVSIANMLCDTTSMKLYLTQPFSQPKPVANASRLEPNTQIRVLALLQIGNYEDALNIALEGQDFTMALLVGSLAGKERWSSVVDSYLRMGISSYSDPNINVLSLLFQVFIGNSKIAIANFYNNQEHINWAVQNWRYIVSVILANTKSVTGSITLKSGQVPPMILEFLVEFGIFLYKQGLILEANLLFVIARIPLSFASVMGDSDVYFKCIGQPTTTESLIWSEIYEYIKTLEEPALKGFPTLLAQKLTYGFALEEQNLSSQATKYNEIVASKIKLFPRKDAYAAILMNSSNILTARINNSSTGWLGKPKLSSVWGQLDKSFSKYIGGDVEKKPNQTPEKDVFGTYTPYTSNHSSVVDLDQTNINQYQPQANYRPSGQVAHHSMTPGNVLSMEHLKKASHHTFGEQAHYETPLRIGESLQGSPGRTYTKDGSGLARIPHNPLPRVHSEIFETNKATPPPLIRGDTNSLILQRSVTHDQLKMETSKPMSVLANDISNIGPPQSLNRNVGAPKPHTGPPRRSSNVSLAIDVHPPPKARADKGKSSPHRRPHNIVPSIDQLNSLQTTPSNNTLIENVPSVPISSKPAVSKTPESDTSTMTATTTTTMQHPPKSELPEESINVPTESIISNNDSNANMCQENPVNAQNAITEEYVQVTPLEHDTNSIDHASEINQETELVNNEVIKQPIEQDIPTEEEEEIIENDVNLENNLDPITNANVPENLPDTKYSDGTVHERSRYSKNENLETQAIIPPLVISNDQNVESVELDDKPHQIDSVMAENDEQKADHLLEFTSDGKLETAPEPPAQINLIGNNIIDEGPARDLKHNPLQDKNHDSTEDSSVETTEKIVNSSKPPNKIVPPKVSLTKKQNAYAPINYKPKPKAKSNSYLPKNATSNPNSNLEQLLEPTGGNDMFAYNSYTASYSNSENNMLQEENNSFQPFMPPASADMVSPSENNFNVPKKSFSNDKFGPIREADEVSTETFEPVIKKNTGSNFNTYTPQTVNTEYNDVIEDESESDEEEYTNKKSNGNQKEVIKKNKATDSTKQNPSIWRFFKSNDNGEKKAIKAKMGNQNSFYYDTELKRWVDKNASEEQKKEMIAATKPGPPPPIIKRKDTGPTSSPRANNNHNTAPPNAFSPVLPIDQLTGKPMTMPTSSSENTDTASPVANSANRFSTDSNIESLAGKKANDLDDLLKVSASVNRGGKRKKKTNRGYVNAM